MVVCGKQSVCRMLAYEVTPASLRERQIPSPKVLDRAVGWRNNLGMTTITNPDPYRHDDFEHALR
jgi:hypothetical protein